MRKFTFTLLMVLVFGSLSFGQYTYTASLQTLTASPNEDVSVNLGVTGFSGIGSFQFYIQVDPAVLTFETVTNFVGTGLSFGHPNGDQSLVSVSWFNSTPGTWANGTLLTLKFKYNGLASPIAFVPANCEVVKLVGVVPYVMTCTSFTDGAISPVLNNTQQATIGAVQATTGSAVSVPLTYSGSAGTSAGAITQRITYDPNVLTFISVTGSGLFPSFVNASASNGVVTFAYTNPSGVLLNTPGTQFNLNFQYAGNTTTPVTFSTGCVISTTTGANIPVTYNNGNVSLLIPPTSFATLPTITNAVQGQVVTVPLTLAGMPSNTTNFNINLAFDNPRMSYVGYANAIQPVIVGNTANTISITNANPLTPTPSINGTFIELKFVYNGVGTANITFAPGCQFSTGSPINVGYTNGTVSPASATVNANIGTVSATSPAMVPIPVTFTDIPSGTDLGAVTMNIGFDATKLTYVAASNPNLATVQVNGNIIHIAWSSTTPVIVNGTPFITLNFNYAASGNASSLVTFLDGCQLANMVGTIVPANWNNGGVNLNHTISGTLSYDNHPSANLALSNVTVYIKSGPEPIPPSTGPVPAIIATATTDGSGFFSVSIPNGTYYVYASSIAPWVGVDNGDVINVRRYAAGLTPNTVDNPLRVRACDINQDGVIDNGDVIPLRRRIAGLTPNPGYVIGDWIFENPSVVVSGSNVTVNFLGICSGEVNGSYPY